MKRIIYCACGRPLQPKVKPTGIVLRCPEHGIQFRFVVSDHPLPEPKSAPKH